MGQVSLRGIRNRYGAVDVIRGIDLDLRDREFLDVVGPSGCGAEMVFQSHARYPHLTVAANVGFARNEVGLIADRSWVLGFGADGRLAA